ncbi:MAG: biopolymer transporter ExbD [Pseudomonadota bacterium]
MLVRKPKRPVHLLNITPLIDVVFILLVFFMLATSFAQYRLIGIETPRETEISRNEAGAVVVMLQADGEVRFDGELIAPEALTGEVEAILGVDPLRGFLVRPEAGVPLERAVSAFDTVRDAGAIAVSFSPPREEDAS